MVQEAVGDDEELKKDLVAQVCLYGDVPEALRWAHFYKIDRQYWPYNVRMLEENPNEERFVPFLSFICMILMRVVFLMRNQKKIVDYNFLTVAKKLG